MLVVLFGAAFSDPGRARSTLSHMLGIELGVTMPDDAVITHAVRVAYRDPARYFELEFPSPAAANAFLAAIRASGEAKRWQVKDARPESIWLMGTPPK